MAATRPAGGGARPARRAFPRAPVRQCAPCGLPAERHAPV